MKCIAAFLGAVLLTTPVAATAQNSWGSMHPLGTVALVKAQADWPSRTEDRSILLRELVRFLNSSGARQINRLNLRLSLTALQEIEQLLGELDVPQPLVVRPEDRQRRGRWSKLIDALGYNLDFPDTGVEIRQRRDAFATERAAILKQVGLDVAGLIAGLSRLEPTPFVLPKIELPLPLGMPVWQRSIVKRAVSDTDLFLAIVDDSKVGLVYYGLTSIDPDTLSLFAANPELVDAAVDHPVPFAAVARSIRVRQGRVVTPLGAESDAAWRDLSGQSPADPVPFLKALLSRDEGRLAWFFDTVFQSRPEVQRFILGSWTSAAGRREIARGAYRWFRMFPENPLLELRPFGRGGFSPATALQMLELRPTGEPEPPSAFFLEEALSDVNVFKAMKNAIVSRAREDVLTPAAFFYLVFEAPRDSQRPRAEALVLAQRMARRFPRLSGNDLAALVRGHLRFPALVKTLERWPVAEPTGFTSALVRAEAFSRLSPAPAHIGLLQFQSAVALLDIAVRSHGLPGPAAGALLAEVSALPFAHDGYYRGALANWLGASLVPALRNLLSRPPDASPVDVLSRVLAGSQQGFPETLEWSGWRYLIDTATRRAAAIRSAWGQQGTKFDELVALGNLPTMLARAASIQDAATLAERLMPAPGSLRAPTGDPQDAVIHADTQMQASIVVSRRTAQATLGSIADELPAEFVRLAVEYDPRLNWRKNTEISQDELARVATLLSGRTTILFPQSLSVFSAAADLREAARQLRTIRSTKDIDRARSLAADVGQIVDMVASWTLPAIVYGAHLAGSNALLLDGKVPLRHNIGSAEALPRVREQIRWALPTSVDDAAISYNCKAQEWAPCERVVSPAPDIPFFVEGSLIGLDLVLGGSMSRSLLVEGPPRTDRIGLENEVALRRASSIASGTAMWADDAVRQSAGAVARGRKGVAAGQIDLAALPVGRLAAVPWALAHEPEALDRLPTMTDLLWLGRDPDGIDSPALGGSLDALSGCLCVGSVAPSTREIVNYQGTEGYIGVLSADLRLRLAELLTEMGLPTQLGPTLFELAMSDVIQKSAAGDFADWPSISRTMGEISREMVDDYLGHLAKIGVIRLAQGARP